MVDFLSHFIRFRHFRLFKMSDSRECIVYKGPKFEDDKMIKYNNKCYKVEEHMESCDVKTEKIMDI